MKKAVLLIFTFSLLITNLFGQETFPVNGVHDVRKITYAFTNAHIIVNPDLQLDSATLIIKESKIIEVGKNIAIPADAVVIDLKGKYIYPAFIDLYSDYGITKPATLTSSSSYPQTENARKGAYSWNQSITPEFNSYTHFIIDTAQANVLRKNGFAAVLAHNTDGIIRGTGAIVLTGNERENQMLLKDKASLQYSFRKGASGQDYPSSQMGAIALIRQSMYDAKWYAKTGNQEEYNIALDALNQNLTLKQIFDVSNKLEVLRADKIGDEFGIQYIIKGGGDEYQRLQEIKNTGATLILPVNFPALPDVEDPLDANLLSITTLKHWELAPANAAMVQNAGILFAFTQAGLENKKDFLKNIRKAISNGLDTADALRALTINPAKIIGIENNCGTLEKGKLANFIITSAPIFEEETMLFQTWVNGKMYINQTWIDTDPRGAYKLQAGNDTYGLLIKGKINKPEFSIIKNTDTLTADGDLKGNYITLYFKDSINLFRLTGTYNDTTFSGSGQLNSTWINWNATFANVYAEKKIDKKIDTVIIGNIMYPFNAFGWTIKPTQQDVLIKNATVWTNEKEGILENYDVLLSGGKISKVSKNMNAKDARIIDGTGKHLTAGIIDEHSHIAISSGVNEGTQAVSAEVRIGDVINCDDINIYRQLAGGVTTSQLLHGSSNPIGGQSAIIKLRWGAAPEEMKFQSAPPFIKFALGENVKRSNWSSGGRERFPQTRMGVEQTFDDAFTRGEEYIAAKKADPANTRIDLELEAIAEILQGKRFVTCHSYVQSEINMLMQVADAHQFRINTFTHILEGYKVADKMKAHGAGGSTFSDWWAYKYEVVEAIPFNASIMNAVGIITAINSDDAEMGRHLNQEAAKSIKYGGMSEEDALKMVTLNPAKLMHIDDKVGSIKEGKDADVVLWSDNPLSIYAKAEKTFVDGILYYDIDTEQQKQEALQTERNRIIAKMLASKKNGEATITVSEILEPEFHCDDDFDFITGNDY
ncbi:MAG: amidohydrolase family protein [Bacteroidetes bacterium]|nr:amidohydrolase family protein [Bacteroidota bacterium]